MYYNIVENLINILKIKDRTVLVWGIPEDKIYFFFYF